MLSLILATKADVPTDHEKTTLIGMFNVIILTLNWLISRSRSIINHVQLGEADRGPLRPGSTENLYLLWFVTIDDTCTAQDI
jgi:hypothetical protein